MSKRKTPIDRAIEDLDQQIAVRQQAREVLVKHQPQPKLALKSPKRPTPKPLMTGS